MVTVFMLLVGISIGLAIAYRVASYLKNRARAMLLRAKQEVNDE